MRAVAQRGGLLAALMFMLTGSAAHAISSSQCEVNGGTEYCEPKSYIWGGDSYGGAYIYSSFGEQAAAMMPFVLSTTGAGAYPVYSVRLCFPPPNNSDVCGPSDYTFQDGVDTGLVFAEKEEPPGSASHWRRFGVLVNAIYACRKGWDSTTADTNFCFSTGEDPDKDVPCPDCDQADVGEADEAGNADAEGNDGSVGNPIHAGTGNKSQVEVDYHASGTGGLEFRRYYNSAVKLTASVGSGWRSNYDRQVVSLTTKGIYPAVMVRRQNGASLVFTYWGGSWHTAHDVSDRLTQLVDGSGNPAGWQYYAAAREQTETFDSAGHLTKIQTRSLLTTTLTYSDASTPAIIAPRAGLLIQVSDPFGRALNFTWSPQEHIATLTDPNSQRYDYAYDAKGNLISVTYPDTAVRTYLYENTSCTNALTGITDENGNRYATYAYDAQCRGTSTEHAGGVGLVTLNYNTGSTAVTDARGTALTMSFQVLNGVTHTTGATLPCSACRGVPAAAVSFDANGNAASRTDFDGNRANYSYDLTRNLKTQRVEGLTSDGTSTAATRTTTTQWHATFRLPKQIAQPKRITTLAYDSQGNVTSKRVQATTDTTGALGFSATATGSARSWTYTNTYSTAITGLLVQQAVDGPRTDVSDVTTYFWDNSGNLTSVANALGQVTTLSNYDPNGRPQQITDPNGLVTTLAYDLRQQLTSKNVGGEITGYTYDSAGQLMQVTLPDGSFLTYTYDAAHRLTQIQDNLSNQIVYTLDSMGNRVQEQVFDPSNALAQTRSRVYDSLNRLTQDIGGVNPAGEITRYGYDNQGNLTTVTDPLGKLTTNFYDALNRLQQVTDPAATGSGPGGNTQYAYDGLDQLTQVTDPRQLATRYTLDGLGNLTRLTSPDSSTTLRGFDESGNLIAQTDARLVSAIFVYDALNRLTQATYTAPTGSGIPPVAIAYGYDQGANGLGRLTSVSEPSGTTTYGYDLHGRLTQETRVIATMAYLTGYRYDSFGRRNQMVYPSGRSVDYSFDALGRVQQVDTTYQGVTQPVVIQVAYQPFGPVKSFAFGNASGSVRRFDLDGRITSYTLGSITRTLAYDDASRITGFTHTNASLDQSFGYDNMNRLTSWSTAATNQGFGYDQVGNRTSQTIGATSYPYTYLALSNQLTSVAGPTPTGYQYDAAGSLQLANQASFGYDARHRLILTSVGSQGARYQLNALGQRVLKTPTSGAATVFHYDSSGGLIGESDTQGNVQVEYLYLGATPIGVIQ